MENYDKELWKTYVVSMPRAEIIIILGQTLSNRIIVWGFPQRRLGDKCSSKLKCLWFEGNPRVKNNNLVLFGCTIESHMRGYFITNHNLGNLWPLVKSGRLQDYSTHFNQQIQNHVKGILSFPICLLNSKESLAFVKLERIISELQEVE